MAENMKKAVSSILIPPRKTDVSNEFRSPQKYHEAPYHALLGVVTDGRTPQKSRERNIVRTRIQTGMTNRWRLPETLRGDLLGSNQALKAINFPFNQNLVDTLSVRCPSINPMLLTCKDFSDMNDRNWSVVKKVKKSTYSIEDDIDHLPPI